MQKKKTGQKVAKNGQKVALKWIKTLLLINKTVHIENNRTKDIPQLMMQNMQIHSDTNSASKFGILLCTRDIDKTFFFFIYDEVWKLSL